VSQKVSFFRLAVPKTLEFNTPFAYDLSVKRFQKPFQLAIIHSEQLKNTQPCLDKNVPQPFKTEF
jgi:hypothetical protein